tara:strand:- start:12 stop:272 length:261 start_codon:yes stop_codon:yes gene_type:complete
MFFPHESFGDRGQGRQREYANGKEGIHKTASFHRERSGTGNRAEVSNEPTKMQGGKWREGVIQEGAIRRGQNTGDGGGSPGVEGIM